MPRQDLTPLLHARSVAIVGISQLPRFGGRVFDNLRRFGYPGKVFGVNPRYATLYDQPCYPALSDLPERPDLAILAVPNDRLLAAMQEAAACGVPAVVTSSSAYSEPVEGQPTLQEQLVEVAREHSLAVCGPNCMGFISFGERLVASGYEVAPLPAGPITFISHSGTTFDSLWQNRRGLRFNYLISSGNEIATTVADYMQHALSDPATRAIGMFIETVRDPATFRAALAEAAQRGVPVVALKVGRSRQGAALAQAHSGALAGEDAAYDALFAHYGVQRARSLDEMLDALELFAAGLRPRTRAIASIHDSGGQRGLLVDLAEAEGVQFAAIQPDTEARLAAALEPGLTPMNPLDAWGTGNDFGRIYRDCMLALDADPATGLNVWVADLYPAGDLSRVYVEQALAIQPRLRNPLIFLANVSAAADEGLSLRLRQAGIPVLLGTETGLRAIRHLMDFAEFQRRPAPAAPPERKGRGEGKYYAILSYAAGPLDEHASAEILRAYGVPVAEARLADSLDEVGRAARQLGFPVALKTAAGALHKTDAGGVRLGLADEAALEAAYRDLSARLGPRALVQKMAPPGVELILGLARDPQFGLMLTVGMGGIAVEVFKDARLLALPPRPEDVRAALLGLRGAPMLRGLRGRPPADVEAVVQAALRLADLAHDLGDKIEAVDINPLIALPEGVIAVDALIIPRQPLGAPARWEPGAEVAAPLDLYRCNVELDWIDYNGHMTEASYLTAFGNASDALFRYVGIDEAYRASGRSFYTVETHINFYREVKAGEPLRTTTQLLGLDDKRLHFFHAMHHGLSGDLLATAEQMLVHVDMQASAASPITPGVHTALAAILEVHREMPTPRQVGRQMAVRKKRD
jgi:acyl-CoA synthetase (NDP forming)/acyl-CoA thioesterase FadM